MGYFLNCFRFSWRHENHLFLFVLLNDKQTGDAGPKGQSGTKGVIGDGGIKGSDGSKGDTGMSRVQPNL